MTLQAIIKWFIIFVSLFLIAFAGFWAYALTSFGGAFDTYYSKQDLVDNYRSKGAEIREVKRLINRITPKNKSVNIEFDGNDKLFYFHVIHDDAYRNSWDLNIDSGQADSLLHELNWTRGTLRKLKTALDNANCISVRNGEPCQVGFQRSGMGKYSYNLFDAPIADSLLTQYQRSCTYIIYNKQLVLEYGGGAIGPQCFPDSVAGKQSY
ncbi:hypothetical protein MON38_01540 [Hymenobacter sp. DH14]|uniref:Uncharacterized protein n=1 Tax=Hymenobacter cyanobacteriorum TaxID=2926463 RepID=A0A9X2AGS6_9BACT|nr:hypothetical protein [Hymenobacter cyanobacteriorum]MCI1186084.1 hypothetical protein [Hymenobacter cyanobacteriorum]